MCFIVDMIIDYYLNKTHGYLKLSHNILLRVKDLQSVIIWGYKLLCLWRFGFFHMGCGGWFNFYFQRFRGKWANFEFRYSDYIITNLI